MVETRVILGLRKPIESYMQRYRGPSNFWLRDLSHAYCGVRNASSSPGDSASPTVLYIPIRISLIYIFMYIYYTVSKESKSLPSRPGVWYCCCCCRVKGAASVAVERGRGALSNCTVEIGRWGVKIDLAKYVFSPRGSPPPNRSQIYTLSSPR